jgi:hypothetical protein
MASTRSKLDEIVESFSALEDPRFHINRRPPLPSILVIAVLAVLAGAAGPTEPIRRHPHFACGRLPFRMRWTAVKARESANSQAQPRGSPRSLADKRSPRLRSGWTPSQDDAQGWDQRIGASVRPDPRAMRS